MKYANMLGFSDVYPYEVVREVNDKMLDVREMHTERDMSVPMDFVPGGFAGVCVNQHKQKWIITSDPSPENPIIRIRQSVKRGWRDANGNRFIVSDHPIKFYDFNF